MEQVFDFLNVAIFKVGENYQFTLLNLVLSLVILAASVFVLRKQNLLITQLGKLFEIGEDERRVIRRAFRIIVFWLTIIFVFKTAGWSRQPVGQAYFWPNINFWPADNF